jgi:glycosyltransferase involved in cell wall biosynthesis
MPEARLVIAGRSMPPEFRSTPSMGVEVVGEVESAAEFLDRPGIATVPILSGSGMRVKAVEAMAAGLPVVGTELGLAGLGLKNGTHALIANTPKDFARSIIDLLSDPRKASTLAKNGATHIRQTFDTKVVFKDIISFFKKIG